MSARATIAKLFNKFDVLINPATEDKQDVAIVALNKIVGMSIPEYDAVTQAQTATTDVWSFTKVSILVATITITYTDTTKSIILSVVKT